MRRALNILFLLVVGVFLAHPRAGYAQKEGAIEIEARILPATSGTVTEGSSSSTGTSTSIESGDAGEGEAATDGAQQTGDQAGDQTGDQTGTAQTVDEGGEQEQADVPQEPGTTPEQPTNTMTVTSQNSVLVEVEKQNQIFLRRLLNFEGADRQGEIEVGSLEESTTVDIIHVTL